MSLPIVYNWAVMQNLKGKSLNSHKVITSLSNKSLTVPVYVPAGRLSR